MGELVPLHADSGHGTREGVGRAALNVVNAQGRLDTIERLTELEMACRAWRLRLAVDPDEAA